MWEPDALRDFVRRYVLEGLAMPGAGPGGAGVLVIGETGFEKRGHSSAGVARQYTGAAGTVVNLEERGLPYAVTIQANQKGWIGRVSDVARLIGRIADWLSLPAGPSQLDTRTCQWWVRRLPDPEAGIGADDR
ncbi:transposase [Nonomuraea cavernae]|uniref:transposase n=1 Tax=Nonomuraea cavernae TaxID=2045107 RepID=UPI003F53F9E1